MPVKSQQKINQAGINLIKQFEGVELKTYKDVVGVLTIGYGHTGSDVKEDLEITAEQAEELLKKDLEYFENGVNKLITVRINPNQFSALVSFSYNVGLGNLAGSTLLKYLNEGEFAAAANQFTRWNKAGGKVYPGLTKRREAEKELFLS